MGFSISHIIRLKGEKAKGWQCYEKIIFLDELVGHHILPHYILRFKSLNYKHSEKLHRILSLLTLLPILSCFSEWKPLFSNGKNSSRKAEFLNAGTMHFGPDNSLLQGAVLVLCRMSSGIPTLCHYVRNTRPSPVMAISVSKHTDKCPLGRQNCFYLQTTDLKKAQTYLPGSESLPSYLSLSSFTHYNRKHSNYQWGREGRGGKEGRVFNMTPSKEGQSNDWPPGQQSRNHHSTHAQAPKTGLDSQHPQRLRKAHGLVYKCVCVSVCLFPFWYMPSGGLFSFLF